VENLLPDVVAELEPYWADFNASGFVGSLVPKYAAWPSVREPVAY
jgi:hypothetical protein